MAVALDLGGTPVSIGELQASVEDYTIAQSAEFSVEHDHQGHHTKPFTEPFTVTGPASMTGLTLATFLMLDDDFAQTLTTHAHDLANPDGSPIQEVVIRLQATTTVSLTGIVPYDATKRQIHLIENGGSFTIRLEQDADTFSTYTFSLPGELDMDLESGGVVMIQWDPHSSIWRCLQSGSPMATVQRGTITFSNGGPDIVDGTISAVDFNSAELRSSFKGEAVGFTVGVYLLDDHRVRAERFSAFNSSPATVYFEVSGRLV